jgi:hypothetical protein
VIADLQGPKRCDRHLGYGSDILVRLAPDEDLWVHGLLFILPTGQRVCRKSPFESVAISRGRWFLNQHLGIPFRLQLLLYFQAQPTITLHPFRRMPVPLFEQHPAIFSDGYANPGP